jgi:hypothetical protein
MIFQDKKLGLIKNYEKFTGVIPLSINEVLKRCGTHELDHLDCLDKVILRESGLDGIRVIGPPRGNSPPHDAGVTRENSD